MSEPKLTPEHVAALQDMAERYIARREAGGVPGVVVRSTRMGAEERKVFGAKNDLRSAQIEHAAALKRMADAQQVMEIAQRNLAAAAERLRSLVGE